jgi:hypothetical protein
MRNTMALGFSIIIGLMIANAAHAAERVVVCEELYQEG